MEERLCGGRKAMLSGSDILECGVPRLTVKGGVIRRSEES
jgi:hypothetical protein